MKKNIYLIFILLSLFLGTWFFLFDRTESLASSTSYIYYKVRRGDTLERIARRYGINIEQLKEWNRLRGNKIYVGQRLIVGIKKEAVKREERGGAQTETVYYIVKRGDTLDKIARRFGISVRELKELNGLRSDRIFIGQRLVVKRESKKERIERSEKKVEREEELTKRISYIYYKVKRGDTLGEIARRYGVSVRQLREWNRLRGDRIYVGQRLIVGIKKETVKREERKEIPSDTERIFSELEKKYQELSSNPQATRTDWLKLLTEYRRLYLLYPGSETAPKAILKTANIYYQIYKTFSNSEDLKKAIERYYFLIDNYPKNSETEEAYYWVIQIYEKELKNKERAEKLKIELKQKFPQSIYISKLEKKEIIRKSEQVKTKEEGKTKEKAEKIEKSVKTARLETSENTVVTNLKKVLEVKPVTGEDYSRVIINVSDNFEYQANILKGTEEKPPRIYVDIYPAILDNRVSNEIDIKDSLLTKVRVAQFDEKTVRVVLDLSSLTSYKIFKLKEPYQLVLDLIGKEKIKETLAKRSPKKSEEKYINLARQFGLGIKRIVIDPGHGGEDPGAVGPSGLKEKDIVLMVAQLLAQKIKKRLNIEVILTRNQDKFIPLIQRPAIANSKRADLFISIHTNASPDKKARGVETYYLNFTTDPEAMRVAALENAATEKSLSDLQDLIKAILANTKLSESRLLAEKVQESLVKTLKRYYPDVEDRGVKYAPFLVLVGARMPAILIEISFITNAEEESRLKNSHYLEMIADGIAKGIETYIQSLKLSQTYSNDKKS